MEVFDGHRALLRPLARPAVALGNFDGVHLGHQALLSAAAAAARAVDGDAVVYTFDPHPARVLAPHLAPPLLTSKNRKLELLAAAGIGVCILEPFTPELSRLSPDAFARILVDVLGVRHVVVGFDFTYGHNRAGTVDTLRAFMADRQVAVDVIGAVAVDGIVVSSTKVREFLHEGKLDGARLLLGRDYDVDGVVVRGAGRGRDLGFPTANVRPDCDLVLTPGIYAVRLALLDAPGEPARAGAASLGTNPTFTPGGALSLEVHVLDFDGDLYGRPVRVQFVERLRGEARFDSAGALVAQMRDDVARARAILGA